MLLSDLSVRRPVLALVASLLIIAFGAISFAQLPLRELPDVDQPVVSITTLYRGASAETIDTRITKPIEDQLNGIEGIDLIRSQSRDGRSSINVEFKLSRDIEAAANDVRNAVARAQSLLPDDIDNPEITKADSDADPIIWMSLVSDKLSRLELTDYANRYLLDRFSTLDGVGSAQVAGGFTPAMRIWMNPRAMAARGLTVDDIESALGKENLEAPAGYVQGKERDYTVRLARGYSTPEEFARMPVGRTGFGEVVRLGEVARVEVAPDEARRMFRGNGTDQVGLGVTRQSQANQLEVGERVRAMVEQVKPTLPEGVGLFVTYDSTQFIDRAVKKVYQTLLEATVLVILVIFLFLGTMRAAFVPAAVIPVCIMGAFIALLAFGFSINLLTLLALVLAIGLVVDDSIVVLENIQRRVDEGEPREVAAQRGTRQVAFAVIATTAVLITVFTPLLFVGGYVGRLFVELALTVCAVMAISCFCSLTLTPMMCSKLLKPVSAEKGRIVAVIDGIMNSIRDSYARSLEFAIDRKILVVAVFLFTVTIGGFVMSKLPSELLPNEDRGTVFLSFSAPEGTGFDAAKRVILNAEGPYKELRDSGDVMRSIIVLPGFGGNGANRFNSGGGRLILAPWEERHRSARDISDWLNKKLGGVPGGIFRYRQQGALQAAGGGGSDEVSITLLGAEYSDIMPVAQAVLEKARASDMFVRPRMDYEPTNPRVIASVDRERAAALGVSVATIGNTLEAMMGSTKIGTYIDKGEEYDVLIQADRPDRSTITDMEGMFVRSDRTGELVPLANVLKLENVGGPSTLYRLNRMRAITIGAGLGSGTPIGPALAEMEKTANEAIGQRAITVDYQGASKQYRDSTGEILFVFGIAFVIVFLTLAAQFESFVHPAVIMLTAPLALAGGAFGVYMFDGSLNIYSQIGFIILIALASKNGILIVEFANQLRDEGRTVREAILESAALRLRPILMTSIATIAGAMPLVLGHGAGAETRAAIGVVIVFGVAVATMLTLIVVPAAYDFAARFTQSPETIKRRIEKFERDEREIASQPAE